MASHRQAPNGNGGGSGGGGGSNFLSRVRQPRLCVKSSPLAGASYQPATTAASAPAAASVSYSRPITAEDLRARLLIAQQQQQQPQPHQQQPQHYRYRFDDLASESSASPTGSLSPDDRDSPPPPAPAVPPPSTAVLRQNCNHNGGRYGALIASGDCSPPAPWRQRRFAPHPHPQQPQPQQPLAPFYLYGEYAPMPYRLPGRYRQPDGRELNASFEEGSKAGNGAMPVGGTPAPRRALLRREQLTPAVRANGVPVPHPPPRPPPPRKGGSGRREMPQPPTTRPFQRAKPMTEGASESESSDLGLHWKWDFHSDPRKPIEKSRSDTSEREPGDGEEEARLYRSSSDTRVSRTEDGEEDDGIDDDVDEEDVCDCLDDDSCIDGETGSAMTSRAASRLATTDEGQGPIRSPLIDSNFTGRPPVLRFVPPGERVELLPWEYRRLLKWRLSSITPLVVKYCIQRSHFRISKKSYDWIGYFGKHMKSAGFRNIREYQKVNHFPGTFQIGRKDRLWRNLYKMQVHYGKKEFNFFPQTFCLPVDLKQLKRVWEDGGAKQKWIVKPPASARGIGVRVIHKWSQVPKKRAVIVQRYLYKPLLINGSKFDLRIYVYVSNFDPLRIYVHEDGLVRFASQKYSASTKNLSNRFMHLTNYSVNKKNAEYLANSDDTVCQGHKWSLKSLWPYLREHFKVDTDAIWVGIKDVVVKTVISGESLINSMIKTYVRRRHSVHELFGFDILLDENFKPWILECNISPSLHSNSQLDINIKGHMIKDMMNIAGFEIPEKSDVVIAPYGSSFDMNRYDRSSPLVTDRRLWDPVLSVDERSKHAYFCNRSHDDQAQQQILDIITPDDLRILTESVDEWGRAGGFQRVFPAHQPQETTRYLRFMSQSRYYNLLLHAFLTRFHAMPISKGINFLEDLCDKGLHLQSPTCDPQHQWVTPSSLTSARGDGPGMLNGTNSVSMLAETCVGVREYERRLSFNVEEKEEEDEGEEEERVIPNYFLMTNFFGCYSFPHGRRRGTNGRRAQSSALRKSSSRSSLGSRHSSGTMTASGTSVRNNNNNGLSDAKSS